MSLAFDEYGRPFIIIRVRARGRRDPSGVAGFPVFPVFRPSPPLPLRPRSVRMRGCIPLISVAANETRGVTAACVFPRSENAPS